MNWDCVACQRQLQSSALRVNQPNGKRMVRWLEFHTQRFNGTHGNGLAGFEIEFAEPVAGPIALGFGCHFGLGLFVPC